MKDNFKAFPLSYRMILRDPVNLLLAVIPTVIALLIYFLTIYGALKNLDIITTSLRDYIHSPGAADVMGKILTAVLIIFIFILMSWTFVIVVGIIAAPFNSMLSSRIERKLVQRVIEEDKKKTFKEMLNGLGKTFINEAKKLIFIAVLAVAAFFLNFFPIFYPLALILVALLLTVQFIDYSWSRHDMTFGACVTDAIKNIVPYTLGGFFFLLIVTVPVVNAFVPAWATSYFTVLWLHRQKKIPDGV